MPCALQGVPQLALCLSGEREDHMQAAAAWAIGQIGRHTPEHAQAVAAANLLPVLLRLYLDANSSEDLQVKVRGGGGGGGGVLGVNNRRHSALGQTC